ncbi:hypothetical protein [Streptomyces sp. NPDC096132]|uniref:hypothetical protein n=1 Tax=Streptomyces sp. NPDC096132 TaxID=3366075 RepID=UPI0038296CB4
MSFPPPVDWARLHHAYGPADDVPGQLAALADADPEVRAAAVSALTGNVYHQGTRWQASAHAVAPLVALVDRPGTPDRAAVLYLLHAVALGDPSDDDLPFDPGHAFAEADRVGPADEREVIRVLYEEDDPDVDSIADVGDAVVVLWAADAYRAVERHTASVLAWLRDPDPVVVSRAAALAVWYPRIPGLAEALTTVPLDSGAARASANLALAHLPGPLGTGELASLTACLTSPHETTRVTAAVALARHRATALPDEALTVLVQAYDGEVTGDVPGWDRALRGHVARALHRLGL